MIAGAVLIRPKNSFIVIDEPEHHLNPAISGPLLSALVRVRQDVGFVFSTHDLNLLGWLKPQTIVHLRDSALIVEHPEQRRYDYSILTQNDDVPEELRFAILGTRQSLLLVEGTATSEDQTLYGHLYPGWHIVARGSCDAVISGVKQLSRHQDFHWLKVAGVIDRDGRQSEEAEALATLGVYALSVPTIENLFLHPCVLSEMADAAHDLFAGLTGPERIAAVEAMLPDALLRSKDEMIARRVVWEAQRISTSNMVSVKDIKDGTYEIPAINLTVVRTRVEAIYQNAVGTNPTIDSLQALPIKATLVPSEVVRTIGYPSFSLYKQAVLGQIEGKTPRGVIIQKALSAILPQITV